MLDFNGRTEAADAKIGRPEELLVIVLLAELLSYGIEIALQRGEGRRPRVQVMRVLSPWPKPTLCESVHELSPCFAVSIVLDVFDVEVHTRDYLC